MKTLQEKKWEVLREENRKLTEELDKYKETVQELQGTSSKMFDKLLEKHLSKFQENPYHNEENEEFKNDIKLLIQVAKQIKDFKNSQNQVAIRVLTKARFDIQNIFNQVDKYDGEYCELYWKLSKFFNQFNDYFDKQIESLKGE